MVNNIDRPDAPIVNSVIPSRNWEKVLGDERAVFGFRFRNSTSTDTDPVYDPVHASEFHGRMLERRPAAGATPLSANFTFSNVPFTFTNSSGLQISNREVQAHIPWADAGLAALNPEPNRGTSFLYDIWQVTYPNSENSYITDTGDLLHFERTVAPGTLIDTITRLNDRQLLIPAESVGVDFGLNLGDIVRVTYIFDGRSTQDTLLGEVSATGSASGINNIEIDVISFDANNGEDIRNDPNTNIPDPFGGSVEASSAVIQILPSTTTNLSRHYFRGVGLIRERITDDPSALPEV